MPWMERAAPGRLQPIYIHLHKAPSRPARRALTRQFVCWSQRGAVIGREAPRRRHGERNGDVPRPPCAGFWDRQRAPRTMGHARRPCTTTVHHAQRPCTVHPAPWTMHGHAPCTMTVHRTPRVTHHGPRTMTVHHDRDRAPRPCTTQNDHAPCTSHSPQRTTDQAPCAGHTPSSPGAWGPGTGAGCDPAGPHIAARAHGCSGAAEEDGGCVLAPAGRLHQGPPPVSALLALLAALGLRLHAFIHALLPGTAAPLAAASPGSHPGARLPAVSPPCSQLLSPELLALRSRTCPSPSPSSPSGPRQRCP